MALEYVDGYLSGTGSFMIGNIKVFYKTNSPVVVVHSWYVSMRNGDDSCSQTVYVNENGDLRTFNFGNNTLLIDTLGDGRFNQHVSILTPYFIKK